MGGGIVLLPMIPLQLHHQNSPGRKGEDEEGGGTKEGENKVESV